MTVLERAVFGSKTPLFALKSNGDHIEGITSFYLLIYLNSICVGGTEGMCAHKSQVKVSGCLVVE